MLSVAEEYLRELNPDARLEVFGQDYNNESFAICCSDMMIKGQNPENIKFGDSFTKDGLPGRSSITCWRIRPSAWSGRKNKNSSRKSMTQKGFDGRFGAGLPRINDGSFLFLQHMISKMKPEGSRIGDRFQWFAAVYGMRDRAKARFAGGSSKTTGSKQSSRCRPDVLQHRHFHLYMDRHQPQTKGTARKNSTSRRKRVRSQDAKKPGQ